MRVEQKEWEKESPLEAFLKTYSRTTNTPATYRKLLGVFFREAGVDVEEFVKILKENPEKAEALCYETLHKIAEDRSPNTTATIKTALNQFLDYLKAPFRVKLKGIKPIPKALDYIPSIEEIEILISKARIEMKPVIALIAFSGMRISDVLKLRLENIADDIEYDFSEEKYKVKRFPAKIIVFQKKTGRPYVTFMGPKCANIVITYLNFQVQLRKKPFSRKEKLFNMTYDAFVSAFSRLAKSCAIEVPAMKRIRPYSLRKYFRLHVSKLGEETAEYLMGHVRGITSLTATYTGLRDLDERAIEELREKFAEIVPELEGVTFTPKQYLEEVDKLKKELEWTKRRLEMVLKVFDAWLDLSPEDVRKLLGMVHEFVSEKTLEAYKTDLREEQEEVARMIAEYIESRKTKIKKPAPVLINNGSGRKHVIVQGEEELLAYLDRGYELVKELSNNRYILRIPK